MESKKNGKESLVLENAFVAVQPTIWKDLLRPVTGESKRLISIKNLSDRLTLAVGFEDSTDKYGFGQLYPFFYLATNLRLYECGVSVTRSGDLVTSDELARSLIGSVRRFAFENAELDFGSGTAAINLHTRNGEEPALRVALRFRRTTDVPEDSSQEQPRQIVG